MRRTLLFFIVLLAATVTCYSQQWVSTNPDTRHALIEEFTGVRCAGCPAGDDVAESLLQMYGGDVCAVGYHLPTSLFCVPYGNDPDLRRAFLAAFADTSLDFTGSYPSAFVNRIMWPGESYRNIGKHLWPQIVQSIISQPSPLNIGLHSVYDPSTHLLNIDVEVYFTATVTDPLTIYVELSEGGIITIQDVMGVLDSNYVHQRVFREALCDQWGDSLNNSVQGTLYTHTFAFDNSSMQYNMNNCEALVFVRNASTEEVITAEKETVSLSTSVSELKNQSLNVYPNPFKRFLNISSGSLKNPVRVFNLYGHEITGQINVINTDKQNSELDFSEVPGRALYFVLTGEKLLKVYKE